MPDSRIDTKRNRRVISRKEKTTFLGKFPNNSLIKENRNKYPFISQKKMQRKNILVNYLRVFKLLIVINLFSQTFEENNNFNSIECRFSNITLKINGNGIKMIFNSNISLFKTSYYPDIIYINGEKQLEVNHSYYFNQTENYVDLIWDRSIKLTQYMFYQCSDITEMDLSNFDTSLVKSMTRMFGDCSSLTSINLTNFDTSQVTKMNRMFQSCSSLTSLDLSYFDTSQVLWMNHMFYNCSSLTSLNITQLNTSKTSDMEYLFAYCTSLTSLDFSHFDISSSRQVHYMFSNCINLISLDLSNFKTSQINITYGMFLNCKSLKEVNLSNFDTSKVKFMYSMFENCTSLTSLDISNFYTPNLANMNSMFSGCSSLTSLDLSSFDTSLVTNFRSMFYGCSNLTSLDLSNFNTSKAIKMYNMFDGCINLEYINLLNFSEENLNKSFAYDIFKNVPENIVICMNDNSNIILAEINKTNCYSIGCSNKWILEQNKIINETGECIHTCYGKYEYNGKCLDYCKYGYYIDNIHNINRCKCELDNRCLSCSPESLNLNLCLSCNDNFYPMEKDPLNKGDYINCYKEI